MISVCSKCWNAECSNRDHPFVQIDQTIEDIIEQLNLKGYLTSYCCGGHLSNKKNGYVPPQVYISFQPQIILPSIPFGFQYIESLNQINSLCPEYYNILLEQSWLDDRRGWLREWAMNL